jgi:hypothetical protein
MGGVGVWQSLSTTAGPPAQPAGQTSGHTSGPLPDTDEGLWRKVVDGTDSHPFETEGSTDGAIAVVWRALEQPGPTFALVIREADGTVHGRRRDEPFDLTPLPGGGWMGVHGAYVASIATDGTVTQLAAAGPSRPARPGDVFVHGEYGVNMLYRPSDRSLSTMPILYGDIADGYVTPDGELVTCGRGQGGVTLTVGDKIGPNVPGATCVLAGRGDDVTMVGLGDDPDGGIPMTGLVVAHGDQVVQPRMTTMLGGVTSVLITPAGTTVITDASTGDWYLLGADGAFRPTDRKVGQAFLAGERLYVTQYGFMNAPLSWSDDDGRTWHEAQLPGNEE